MGRMVVKPGDANLDGVIKDLASLRTKVGWFESAKYPDGTPVAYVATINEYGYPEGGIPPRPFFRPTIAERRAAWAKQMRAGAKQITARQATALSIMEQIALGAQGDFQKAIARVQSPPLKRSTLYKRAKRAGMPIDQVSKKPLNDTGQMLATLTTQTERK